MTPLKTAFIFTAMFLAVSLMAIGVHDVHLEWRAGHLALFQSFSKIDWFTYRVNTFLNKGKALVHSNDEMSMPHVRLYVPEQAQRALIGDLPESMKAWQEAKLEYPDGRLRSVKVRYRGDNPVNWAFAKKSWRVKTPKRRTLEGTRSFDYIVPQPATDGSSSFVDWHFVAQYARSNGIIAANTRLVELYLNDVNQGLYIEVERLDESFLRNNNLMPVNLYKGEQRMKEKRFGVDSDLFNNPDLWSKVSVNNQLPEQDVSDISAFIDLMRRAESSRRDFNSFKRVASLEDWSRFAAMETVFQNYYDARHNSRLLFDVWRGKVLPILHDPEALVREDTRETEVERSGGRHGVLRLYGMNGEFRFQKYQYLFDMLKPGGSWWQYVSQFEAEKTRLIDAIQRDPNIAQALISMPSTRGWLWNFNYPAQLDNFFSAQKAQARTVFERLTAFPKLLWSIDGLKLAFEINGLAPVNDLTLHGVAHAVPHEIVWDRDGNGRIDEDDPRLPFVVSGDNIMIKAAFISNLVHYNTVQSLGFAHYSEKLVAGNTRFNLLIDNSIQPERVSVRHALSGETRSVAQGGDSGTVPDLLNYPITSAADQEPEIWSGRIHITHDRQVEVPVMIRPGTEIIMSPQASLVFRQRVEAQGTDGSPIKFTAADEKMPWGTIALLGSDTSGSAFSHVEFSHGSGETSELVRFISMVSVHDTKDIKFDHVRLSRNHLYDDMMHVIYSRNVVIENSVFLDARADALDSDISEIRIRGTKFLNSGNDAIDLMASRAVVQNVNLISSGDKGVSVGEHSNLLLVNSLLERNQIGVESKDNSEATIVHSQFEDNKATLNAYWKNWRYGTGGRIEVDKTIIDGKSELLTAKRRSSIKVYDSAISSEPSKLDKRVSLNSDVEFGIRKKARSNQYRPEVLAKLKEAEIDLAPEIRGLLK